MSGGGAAQFYSGAGGKGGGRRRILDRGLNERIRSGYPVGTTVINVTGSFLLGLLTGLATSQAMPRQWQLVVGTGLLGGYTTFSTASFETVRLIEDRRYVAAACNGLGMLIVCTAAAALGFATAHVVTR